MREAISRTPDRPHALSPAWHIFAIRLSSPNNITPAVRQAAVAPHLHVAATNGTVLVAWQYPNRTICGKTHRGDAWMRIQTIEHVPFEGPAAIASWANERGHALGRTRIFRGEPLPPVGEVDLLVDLGGPMGADDEARHPWLAMEKDYLRHAVDTGCGILGICLGAQLLAEALGGRVTRNPVREIGWFPVTLTQEGLAAPVCRGLPKRFTAFHWHGDTFSIPPGGTWLASSEACAHQAFAVGPRLLGLQFHLETTPESMERLMAHCADELVPAARTVQTAAAMRDAVDNAAAMRGLLDTLFDTLTMEIRT